MVNYSSEAIEDLVNFYNCIANEQLQPENATSLIDAIRKQIRSIDQMPLRNPLVSWSPWDKLGMRHFTIKNHIVFYLVDDEQLNVKVTRILSSRRNIPSILNGEV